VVTVAALATNCETARAKWNAKQAAEQAARTATSEWLGAINTMSIAGAMIIDQIRFKAKTGGAAIWDLAQLPQPAIPTPVGDPGEPTDFTVKLTATGALDLKWKCENPEGAQGTIYQIYRKTGSGEFVYVGGSGDKSFLDDTLPAGSTNVQYKMQAVRSTAVGPWAVFNVAFGVDSSGSAMASVTQSVPAKIAA
jgi:hypothetical protein